MHHRSEAPHLSLDLPRALHRGRFMWSIANMEWNGVPWDVEMHNLITRRWEDIKLSLVREMDAPYGVYEGTSFREARFADYLIRHRIPWPVHPSGRLALDKETFSDATRLYPQLGNLKELRASLSALKLHDLAVGQDGRVRCMLSPFRTKTSRNAPSTTRFPFGPAKWIRFLIRPELEWALGYIDFSQEEFAIAGVLSGDSGMVRAYESGDFYMEFAIMAGAAPPGATEETHPAQRTRYKKGALAVLYGQSAPGLAVSLGTGVAEAASLLEAHRRAFPTFWRWADAIVDHAMLIGDLRTPFGWPIRVSAEAKPRTFRNYLMQATGADILRVACILVEEAGVAICAPIHDALLIMAPAADITEAVAASQGAMERASEIVLGGFKIRTKAQVVGPGERFHEPRGLKMWETVRRLALEGA